MDDFLDIVWFKIVEVVKYLAGLMDLVLAPLSPLGPALIILILVFITVCFTKTLSRFYSTKRYRALQKEFNHWFKLRKEAVDSEDREKGKALAKNIDQAKLNKVYYDYFFEGLLKNMLTIYLPVLCMAAYVNEAFRTDRMVEKFGREYVFKFSKPSGEPVLVGALFWFVVSLLMVYLVWFLVVRYIKNRVKASSSSIKP
ncbi:MAG: hypothetical protein ABFS43_03730 [Thermodesulfobacteriota bacterium]